MADNATPRTRGYLSEADKKRFTITAGVLGTIFLLAQFVLPLLIMAVIGLTSQQIFEVDFARRDPYRVAPWQGELWFVERDEGFGDSDRSALYHIDDEGDAVLAMELADNPDYLIAADDTLWLISKSSLAYYRDGQHYAVDVPQTLAEISAPFLLDGRPAVLERWPTDFILQVHDGALWQPRGSLEVVMPDPDCGCGLDWAKAVAGDLGVHVFLEFGDTLYHGLWQPELDQQPEWEVAGSPGEDWWPLLWRGQPAFVSSAGYGGEVVIRHLVDGRWTRLVVDEGGGRDRVSAVSPDDTGGITVFSGSSYGRTVHVRRYSEDAIFLHRRWIGEQPGTDHVFRNTVFSIMGVQYGGTILLPVILALILSGMMKRYRVRSYSTEEWTVSHASLARRALAQLVDVAVVAAPMIVSSALFMRESVFFGGGRPPESIWDGFAMMWPIFASLGWALLMLFVFAVVEGRTGLTPGKWVTRIRVLGTDLKPCGFGRALIRNLLKTVDGFFNFIVGIMVVALSENWQRVGDMAARTVVVDDRTWQQRPSAGRSFSRANGAAEPDGG